MYKRQVNNTGNQVLAGRLQLVAGRGEEILYRATAEVEVRPGGTYRFHWDGRAENGTLPRSNVYAVAARLAPSGHGSLTATDWFRVT